VRLRASHCTLLAARLGITYQPGMNYTLAVNGQSRIVDVEGAAPLLWVLRDELELKGSKFGCGMGLCGACTVHLNGKAARSCITPVSAVGAQAVTTIEGIGSTDLGKKVQSSWLKLDVMQCGYCQAGQARAAPSTRYRAQWSMGCPRRSISRLHSLKGGYSSRTSTSTGCFA
jgi:isoquinoline 1-oxidoreductase subunit alpha